MTDIAEDASREGPSPTDVDLVLNQLGEAAYLFDQSGRLHYVNDEVCRMLGRSRHELLGRDLADVFHDAHVGHWRETWSAIRKSGSISFEARQPGQAGDSFPVEIKASRFDLEGGAYVLCLARDISDWKAYQTRCAENQHCRDIFDHSPDGLYLLEVTEEGRFRNLDINPALARSTGMDPSGLIGRYVDETVSKEAADAVVAKYRRCVEAAQRIEEEIPLDLPAGSFWYRSTLMPVRNADGRIHRIVGMSRDVTETKRIELALAKSELEFRTLAEHLPDNLIRYDPEGNVVYVNPACCESLGLPREVMLGLNINRPTLLGDFERYRDIIMHGTATEAPEEVKLTVRRSDGELRIHAVQVVTERDARGAITGTLAIGRDITEQERAAALLHERSEALRAVVENSPDFIARYDRDGRRLYVNPALETLFGRPAAELIGTCVADGSPMSEAADYLNLITQVFESSEAVQGELPYRTPGGETRWGHMRLVPEFGPGGNVASVLSVVRDITEMKKMELALRDKEQRYRDVFDNSLEGIFLVEVTPERRFRSIEQNAALERITGITYEQAVGFTVEETLPEPVASQVNAFYTLALDSGQVIEADVELNLPVGLRTLHVTVIPVRDTSGCIHRICGIASDITEKKCMEAALAEREREFRTLAENLPDHVVRYDTEGRVVYMNPMLTRTLGIRAEDYLGKPMPRAAWRDHFDAIILGEAAPEEIKIALVTPAGERQTHLVRFVIERDEGGDKIGTLAIGRDITEMERAAALLHERAEALRAVVENSPDAIARYDREGRRVYVNPAMARIFGRPVEEVIGTAVEQDSPISVESGYPALIRKVLEKEEELQAELPFRDADGEERWVHLRAVPEFGPNGEVASVLALGRDITGIKQTEHRLKQSRAELRELAARRETAREEERKRIAREMHDELGQMLMALRLEITVAEHLALDKPVLREKIGRLMGLVERTTRVVRGLMAALRPAALDMGLITGLEWLANDFRERTGIDCAVYIGDRTVQFDEERSIAVFRIVQESLTNVARYAHAGAVSISLERRGAHYHLEVRDDGCGFDPAMPRKNSFGLLGISERAAALGGAVSVISAPGKGTVIEVNIPETQEERPLP